MNIREAYDVAVIGAGPAGLTAATLCAEAGLATVLFDEQPAAGGQIYRAIANTPLAPGSILGDDYWRGRSLVDACAASGAQHVPGATVWSLSREREIGVSHAGVARLVRAQRVILATGAIERPFPIPGWTLPGVMTAGAAQILLKTAALVPEGRTVLAGSGPLLWLLARQYLDAGAEIAVILDTTPRSNLRHALVQMPAFLASPYFAKGLSLLRAVRRRVRVVSGVTALAAEGSDRLAAVRYTTARGEQRLPADLLLLHRGVVPNVNLAMAAGIPHRWDEVQLCFVPERGEGGAAALDDIAIAGDGGGIAGAEAAAEEGRLAAVAAIRALKPGVNLDDAEIAARRSLARWRRGRAFLDALYRPGFQPPDADTIVCRCEEVRAREVAAAVEQGCTGPNQLKAFTRCGMGPCQGRLCGLTVTQLIASLRDVSPAEVGYYRLRPPVKPVTLGELAGLPTSKAAMKAVVRD